MRLFSLAHAHRARLLRGIAALVLLCGFADLARGGLTIAPLLLVAGYLALVPLAILAR